MVVGTLEYRRIRDENQLRSEMSNLDSALTLCAQALREVAGPVTWPDLLRRLSTAIGWPEQEVTKALKGGRPHFLQRPDVSEFAEHSEVMPPTELSNEPIEDVAASTKSRRKVTTVIPRLVWVEPPAETADAVASTTTSTELLETVFAETPDAAGAMAPQPQVAATPVAPVDSSTGPAAQANPPAAKRPKAAPKPRFQMPDSSLARAKYLIGNLGDAEVVKHIKLQDVTPQDVDFALKQLPVEESAGLIDSLEHMGRTDLLPLAFVGLESTSRVHRLLAAWPEGDAPSKHLGAGLAWVTSTADETFLRHFLSLLPAHFELHSRRIAPLAVARAADADDKTLPIWLGLVSALPHQALRAALSKTNINAFLAHCNRQPFSLRWPILEVAFGLDPVSVRSQAAWGTNLRMGSLGIGAPTSERTKLLRDPWVVENVLVPLGQQELRTISTTASLGQALQWPSEVLEGIPAKLLEDAFRKAAQKSALLGSVLGALGNSSETAMLRASLDARSMALESMQAHVEKLRANDEDMTAELHRAQVRLHSLEEQLAHAAAEQLAASRGELRQARIDGLRAAVEVLMAIQRSSNDGLAAAKTAAALHGLQPIGEPGHVVVYDPACHRLLGADTATRVEIREPGWAWQDGHELVVLRHAAVVIPMV